MNVKNSEVKVGFDYSHNNKLKIEDPSFTDFVEYFFNSGIKLGKIEAGLTYNKLMAYNLFIIGVPTIGPDMDQDEIEDLIKYVNDGGSLLIINDKGGEFENKNNLNALTQYFGIFFNTDQLYDNENFSVENSRPIIQDFKRHFITRDIHKIIHSGGCTLNLDKSVEDENIDVNAIAFSSDESSWHNVMEGDEWKDEPVSNIPIIAASHYGLGKIIAIGNLSIFSCFHDSYGIHAADNFRLISNIITWLLNKAKGDGQLTQPIFTTIPVEQDLFYWIKEKLDEGRWGSVDELINFALKVVRLRMRQQDDPEQ